MGYLIHSTGPWKEHKYIKKIGDRYYYRGENIPGESDNQTGKAKYSEYTKGDSDFNEEHYDEKNRLGNTDFYGYTKPDGTAVLLEEDMKWELPPGTKIDDALIKRLEEYWDAIGDYRDAGNTWTYADWEKGAEEVINGKSIKSIEDMDAMVKSNSRSLDEMAQAVIRGEFGNGKERKEALGENYAEVQKRVNEILKEKKSSGKSSNSKSSGKAISPTAVNAMDKKLSHGYLIHSTGPWKKHKYIKKVGDRYYYTKGLDEEKKMTDLEKRVAIAKQRYKDAEREWGDIFQDGLDYKRAYEKGDISKGEYESYQAEVDAAEASLGNALEEYKKASNNLARTKRTSTGSFNTGSSYDSDRRKDYDEKLRKQYEKAQKAKTGNNIVSRTFLKGYSIAAPLAELATKKGEELAFEGKMFVDDVLQNTVGKIQKSKK